jgi:hypothetical protein
MSAATLTDADVELVERRLLERRMRARLPADPVPPPPDSWEGQKAAADERGLQERRAAARALEEDQIREREAEEQRRREEYERNAPRRAEARAELERLEGDFAAAERLLARRGELELEVCR